VKSASLRKTMSKNKRNRNKQAASTNILFNETDESTNQEILTSSQDNIERPSQVETGSNRFVTYLRTHLWLVAVICFLALVGQLTIR